MNTDPFYGWADDPEHLMLAAARMLVDLDFYDALGATRRVFIRRAVRRYFEQYPESVIKLREAA